MCGLEHNQHVNLVPPFYTHTWNNIVDLEKLDKMQKIIIMVIIVRGVTILMNYEKERNVKIKIGFYSYVRIHNVVWFLTMWIQYKCMHSCTLETFTILFSFLFIYLIFSHPDVYHHMNTE